MSKVLVVCGICGKEFFRESSAIRESGTFCSRSCSAKYSFNKRSQEGLSLVESPNRSKNSAKSRRINFEKQFPNLFNKDFLTYKYLELEYSIPELAKEIGCSECALKNRFRDFNIPIKSAKEIKSTKRYIDKVSGCNNHSWQGGSIGEFRGKGWSKQKRLTKERDNYTCQICGSKSGLSVHHLVPYRFTQNSELTNLVTLCRSCHATQDGELRTLFRTDINKFSEVIGVPVSKVREVLNDCQNNEH